MDRKMTGNQFLRCTLFCCLIKKGGTIVVKEFVINRIKKIYAAIFMCFVLSIAAGILPSCFNSEQDLKLFEDVTLTSGISYTGMTFGASWGDFNGDNLPDLYVTNHYNPGMLYQNIGNGRFKNVTDQYFTPEQISGDKHGAQWADFDNDGDQDLLQLRGGARGIGAESNSFFGNTGDTFEEKGLEVGLSNPSARARMELAYDFDRDGLLDVFLGALGRKDRLSPPGIFIQNQNGIFHESPDIASFATQDVPYAVVSLINNDEFPDFIFRAQAPDRTAHLLSGEKIPFEELNLMPKQHFDDIASGDFNGDLALDLYLARSLPERYLTLFDHRGTNKIISDIRLEPKNADTISGFEFYTTGNPSFNVYPSYPKNILSPEQIYIGVHGLHPPAFKFDLSSEVPGIHEAYAYEPGIETGLFISKSLSGKWQVTFSTNKNVVENDTEKHSQATVIVTSSEPITKIAAIGQKSLPEQSPDRLLININGKLEERGKHFNINTPLSASVNVAAGDFDNDMDLDLYIVCSSIIANHENLLLLNQGDGHFKTTPEAGGALGGIEGVGDAVAIADYDMDGFLDLLVSNGRSMGRSWGLSAQDGGYRLYHNIGNDNHWLEIDLEGTKSNRDGIGAKVFVTAGGITQVRIQDGGIHYRSQNHQRIHFGLGANNRIEKILVHWPSGTIQELKDLSVDQLIRIKEI